MNIGSNAARPEGEGMKGLKLVIIGAGSAYTPEIIDEIIQRRKTLFISSIVLVDIEDGYQRASVIRDLTIRMFVKAGLNCAVTLTLNRREALKNADFVISQIRVGGWQARAEDEKIGLSLGLIGQETTGCGGFMNAMRTIPESLAIARDMEEICPQAVLLNFTNPSGIVTEALLRYSSIRTIGLCNCPINMKRDAAKAVGAEEKELDCTFAGLNHLSFMLSASYERQNIYPVLLEKLSKDATVMKNIPKVEGTDQLIQAIQLIPSPYLQYFYFEPEMLQKQLEELEKDHTTRGDKVEEINRQLFRIYADQNLCEKPKQLSERGGSLYSYAAMNILQACLSDEPWIMTVNTLNQGAIPDLAEEAGVEITCHVSKYGIEPLERYTLPAHVLGLVQMVKRYESLTVEAAVTRSRETALRALLSHPLIHGFSNAQKILEKMGNREIHPIQL